MANEHILPEHYNRVQYWTNFNLSTSQKIFSSTVNIHLSLINITTSASRNVTNYFVKQSFIGGGYLCLKLFGSLLASDGTVAGYLLPLLLLCKVHSEDFLLKPGFFKKKLPCVVRVLFRSVWIRLKIWLSDAVHCTNITASHVLLQRDYLLVASSLRLFLASFFLLFSFLS